MRSLGWDCSIDGRAKVETRANAMQCWGIKAKSPNPSKSRQVKEERKEVEDRFYTDRRRKMQGGVGGEGIALLDRRSEIVDGHEGSENGSVGIRALERERMGVSRERDGEKTHQGHLTFPIG